jgi:hypothetical protein
LGEIDIVSRNVITKENLNRRCMNYSKRSTSEKKKSEQAGLYFVCSRHWYRASWMARTGRDIQKKEDNFMRGCICHLRIVLVAQ